MDVEGLNFDFIQVRNRIVVLFKNAYGNSILFEIKVGTKTWNANTYTYTYTHICESNSLDAVCSLVVKELISFWAIHPLELLLLWACSVSYVIAHLILIVTGVLSLFQVVRPIATFSRGFLVHFGHVDGICAFMACSTLVMVASWCVFRWNS
jgi:hypothetical protein